MRLESFPLRRAVGLVVIIIEAALTDGDHPRMVCGLDERCGAKIGMGIGLVGMDSDAGPNIRLALRDGNDIVPFALSGGDVEKPRDSAFAGIFKHFCLALDEALVIEVAVAVDQPHAASSSSGSSRRGKSGVGCGIGTPPSPASISDSSLSADSGMIGAIATVSSRTAATNVPSTAAIRSGSVLRSAHGACASTYWLQANTALIQASIPKEKPKRSKAAGISSPAARRTKSSSATSSLALPGAGRTPPKFLWTIDNVR